MRLDAIYSITNDAIRKPFNTTVVRLDADSEKQKLAKDDFQYYSGAIRCQDFPATFKSLTAFNTTVVRLDVSGDLVAATFKTTFNTTVVRLDVEIR